MVKQPEIGVDDASLDDLERKRAHVYGELANYHRFAQVSEQIVSVDEAICAARLTTESAAIAHRRVAVLPTTARGGPDRLYIAVDGTGVPMVGAAVADRAGKAPDGRARTRDVRLAALFTQTRIDDAHDIETLVTAPEPQSDQFARKIEVRAAVKSSVEPTVRPGRTARDDGRGVPVLRTRTVT